MKWLLPIMILSLAAIGCEEVKPDASKFYGEIAVTTATIKRSVPDTPAPTPEPGPNAEKCTNCDGTGKVKTGDGLAWTVCDECDGTGRVTHLGRVERPYIEIPFTPAKYTPGDLMVDVGPPYTPADSVPLVEVNEEACSTCADGQCAVGPCDVGCSEGCASGAVATQSVGHSHAHGERRWAARRPVRRLFGGLFRGGCLFGRCR